MNDGDLYVRDGETYTNGVYYPDTPAKQVEEETEAKGIIASSYPIMDEIADWFEERIKDMDSAKYIKSYADTEKVSLEDAHRAFDIARTLIEDKANEFSEFGKERS